MKALLTLLTVAYPLIVYISLSHGHLLGAAFALSGAVVLRMLTQKTSDNIRPRIRPALPLAIGLVVLLLGSLVPNLTLLYPVAVNLTLFIIFGTSLRSPPTVIERIASIKFGPLPPEGQSYCRRVCIMWTIFFALNGAIALDSVFRSLEWWSIYNGLISYIAIGAIFLIELLVRRVVMKRSRAISLGLALILTTPFVAVHAETAPSLLQIRSILKPPAPFRATFSEMRYVSVLTAPLEARGEMECIPGSGIVWRVSHPISKTTIMTPNGITILGHAEKSRELQDHTNISGTLLSLMSGEIERSEAAFVVTTGGTPQAWTITLTPRDALVSEIIARIVINGRDRPYSLEIHHANNDRVVTNFSTPEILTEQEITRVQVTIHEAS